MTSSYLSHYSSCFAQMLPRHCCMSRAWLSAARLLNLKQSARWLGSSEARFALPPKVLNEAGFEVGVTMSPEEADALGLKPFGDGGADDTLAQKPRIYTHGLCASAAASQYVVPCAGWKVSGGKQSREVAAKALEVLAANGFVVLEDLLPFDEVASLEEPAARVLDNPPEGFIPQPLRAGRTECHLPFNFPWAHDWLIRNDLVLDVVRGYMHNNLAAGRTQDEQQNALVQWLLTGAELSWFRDPRWGPKSGALLDVPPAGCSDVGRSDECGPFFGRISVIKTPPGTQPQKHHRDINFPGPAAQLTVQVSLTPLVANNGPLAYVPGSHRMLTPGFEVVANPPLGSVVLYDSFCEHRGIENHTARMRYALYYEFETRGVFSGYTHTHFGPRSSEHMMAFRGAVDPELRQWINRHKNA